MDMSDCIFCRIVNGEIPCRKIYEDSNCIAFLDISPQSKGHTLVVPKKHFENIFDIDEETLCHISSVVRKLSLHIKDVLNPEGIKLVQNNGRKAGQTVFHFHFHIRPVYSDTKLVEDNIEVIDISDEEMDELEKKLKIS
jgi:histidine triad (HIT) family protein